MRSLSNLLSELECVRVAIQEKREFIYELKDGEEVQPKHSRTVQNYADDFFYTVRNSLSETYEQHEKIRFMQLVGYIGLFLIAEKLL